MRKAGLLILPVLFLGGSCSPVKEDIAFKSVELVVTGAESVNIENEGRKVSVTVGSAGGTLRLEATGKNAGHGMVSSIRSAGMDDYYFRTNDNVKNVFPYVFLENDELKVSVLSDNPHITQLDVKENTLPGRKTHEALFGGAYTNTTVIISQAGK